MSPFRTSITSFAACVITGQAMQHLAVHMVEKAIDEWNPFENLFNGQQDDNTPNQVVTPDKQVSYLEEGFFDAFVNVYDGDIDQSNSERFMESCKGLKVDLTKMGHIENAPKLMARIEHNRLQVYKAQHLKSLFENGSMPKGPNWIFVINETGPFQPPWNEHPMDLAEWYMSKIASLDAMSDRAILTKERLDEIYHYARQFEFAIGLVSKRNVMAKPTADTALAKKTMDALITHLTHLEVRLHNGGAIPGAYFKRANQTVAEEEDDSASIVDGTFDEESEAASALDELDAINWYLSQQTSVEGILEDGLASVDNVNAEGAAVGTIETESAANPSLNYESAAVGAIEKESVPDVGVAGDGTADIRRELMEALGAH